MVIKMSHILTLKMNNLAENKSKYLSHFPVKKHLQLETKRMKKQNKNKETNKKKTISEVDKTGTTNRKSEIF